MNIYIPVLTKYARHGGVTQFISNFVFATLNQCETHVLYDHSGEITSNFTVTTFGKVRSIQRKLILLLSMLFFQRKIKAMDHVFLNPSLGKEAMLREMYYAKKCVRSNKGFSIFFHGWSWDFAKHLDANNKLRNEYCELINKASNIFVLGADFKRQLVSWGIDEAIIHLEKTTVNDDFVPLRPISNFDNNSINILFLARITATKGIFEAVDAFSSHLKLFPESRFSIAGDGESLESLKEYVYENKIDNIKFIGFADENMKRKLLKNHDVFLFPTYYPEGMPICIFEAMAYGLTVITRPVGGIPDYFENEKMGFLVNSMEAEDFAITLNSIASDKNLRPKVAGFNHTYVKNNVTSSVVGARILKRFKYAQKHY